MKICILKEVDPENVLSNKFLLGRKNDVIKAFDEEPTVACHIKCFNRCGIWGDNSVVTKYLDAE